MGITYRQFKLAVPFWLSFFFQLMMIQHIIYYHKQLFVIFAKFLCLEREWDNAIIKDMIGIFSGIFRYAFLSAIVPKLCTDIEKKIRSMTHAEFLALFIAYSTQKKQFAMFAEVFVNAPLWQARYAFTAATEDNLNMHAGVYVCIFYLLLGCTIFLQYSHNYLQGNFDYLSFLFIGSSFYDTYFFWEFHYRGQPEQIEQLKKVRDIMRAIQNRF